MLNKKALAGTAGAPKVYVEDVFSTYLYTGTGSSQTITNNIDISGKGGLVWIKGRSGATGHRLTDTVRTATKSLESNSTAAEATESTGLTAFSGTGFTIGADADYNTNTATYVSWTFRKAEKFFDVVTYTGNGASNRAISHNLGSTPGCIMIKCTSSAASWSVWHSDIGTNQFLTLNTSAEAQTDNTQFGGSPTSTTFTVAGGGAQIRTNQNGETYVAYLFAHDAGGFGDAGSDNVITCGSYTADGSGNATVSLGYEPQWLLTKLSSTTGDWRIIDNMRQMSLTNNFFLYPNTSGAEVDNTFATWRPTATGFTHNQANANQTFIYIAIRRGPMKTPTTGTSVFYPSYTADSNTLSSGFPVDAFITKNAVLNSYNSQMGARLIGVNTLTTSKTDTEANLNGNQTWWQSNTTYSLGIFGETGSQFAFRRAPGFFDVVCYTGTGSARTVTHNLGVVPELMIVKRRGTANAWAVYANNDNTDYLVLNTTAATVDDNTYWNDTSPTSSVFSVGTNNATNASGSTYVAYLFASLSGVSKVGSYTGNGSSVTVTTNFQPRFILVKRTDSTGNWIVGDSARGLVSADEPALFLNTTAADTTGQDWVDVSSTGFTVNETALNANVNTGTYIYLAIA